ncbi:MAG: hypothetical protein EOO89_27020, partial [Pedobacter sp.]
MSSTDISKPLRMLNPGTLDSWWGPYDNVAAACLAIPNEAKDVDGVMINFRQGKVVGISTPDGIIDYHWPKSYTNEGLVIKSGIPIDKSVTPEKTSFIQSLPVVTSSNLFNKATVTPSVKRGKDGVNISDNNVSTSAPIPVIPSVLHRARSQSNNNGAIMFTEYDASGAVIPTGGSDVPVSSFTPSANTIAVTVSARKVDLADFMVYRGAVQTVFVPYVEVIERFMVLTSPEV